MLRKFWKLKLIKNKYGIYLRGVVYIFLRFKELKCMWLGILYDVMLWIIVCVFVLYFIFGSWF